MQLFHASPTHTMFIFLATLPILISISAQAEQSSTWVTNTLQQMTVDQKIGQLFMAAAMADVADYENNSPSFLTHSPYIMHKEYIEYLISTYHIGGIIFMGRSTPQKQYAITQHFQTLSAIPLLIGQDLEWGLQGRLVNTVRFPHAMTLGAINISNESLIFDMGREVARQCTLLGVHINFAPVADVNTNPKNPVINERSYGQCPYNVARKSILFANGLLDAGTHACAKHFPGHGDTETDSHHTLPVINHSRNQLENTELETFKQLIAHKIYAVMTAHLAVPALEPNILLPASLSSNITTDLLRNQLGFTGLIITDGLGMRGVTDLYTASEIAVKAIKAGNDILLASTDIPAAHAALKNALYSGEITMQELDAHVTRILYTKINYQPISETNSNLINLLHTRDAYDLAYQLYASAITLVKNNYNLLPLAPSTDAIPVVLVGPHPDATLFAILNNHTPITTYNLAQDATTQTIKDLCLQLNNAPIVIISSCQKQVPTENNSTHKLIAVLHEQKTQVIVVAYENPYNLSAYENADVVVAAYENVADAHTAALKTIIGSNNPTGSLPVSASEVFSLGCGLQY